MMKSISHGAEPRQNSSDGEIARDGDLPQHAITFTHLGRPMAHPHLGGKHARLPEKIKGRRAALRGLALHAGVPLRSGAVFLDVTFWFAVPKSLSAKKRAERMGALHIIDPDGSNVLKLVEDALVGVAYLDDNQANPVSSRKIWGDTDKTVITVGPAGRPFETPGDDGPARAGAE
jgi:Holliday junction resolvase RusA-like endonuclease